MASNFAIFVFPGGFCEPSGICIMISDEQAATIALRLLEAGVEGADIIAAYVDQQTALGDLTDRQLTTKALERSDAAAEMAERVRKAHDALVQDNQTIWARLRALERR